jgi:tRNA pseudouridine55 synthase
VRTDGRRPRSGLVVVDKERGWTSHDVVARCRKIFGQRRVGHAGTLDPDATGVLLVGVGTVTRLLRFVTALPKTYVGEVVLGVATSTLDSEGEVVATWDMSEVTPSDVAREAGSLTGEILQVPPMVSALKVGGRRLHELARVGVEVDRAPRPVVVHSFEVNPTADPAVYEIEVTCSSGTYVRSLASDLGTRLGGGAHLRNLRRTAIGSFRSEDAKKLEELSPSDLLPPAEALRDYPQVEVETDVADNVGNGAVLDRVTLGAVGEGPWAVLDRAGRLLGVYEPSGAERVKPVVVLADA